MFRNKHFEEQTTSFGQDKERSTEHNHAPMVAAKQRTLSLFSRNFRDFYLVLFFPLFPRSHEDCTWGTGAWIDAMPCQQLEHCIFNRVPFKAQSRNDKDSEQGWPQVELHEC